MTAFKRKKKEKKHSVSHRLVFGEQLIIPLFIVDQVLIPSAVRVV